jgi:hypothetical protein
MKHRLDSLFHRVNIAILTIIAGLGLGSLQAAPTGIAVTNLSRGQRFSTNEIAVCGRAWIANGVGNVFFRVNTGPWQPAQGTTNWTAPVVVSQRSNVFQAYAESVVGAHSATSSVPFVYAPKDTLAVVVTGQGKVIPDYNGKSLDVGLTYSVNASPGNGYRLDRWVLSANGAETIKTGQSMRFLMQSNLTVTAVFVDSTRPSLQITNLVAGQRLTASPFLVKGRAQDNTGVSSVWCRLNEGEWILAAGTGAWEASLAALEPQTNVLRVYAEDAAGNRSLTNTVRFVYLVKDVLTLATNGAGSISCNFTDNTLELGRRYTVTARPAFGNLFAGWSGTLTSNTNPLSFIMQSNMVLAANFVTNPFPSIKGDYVGLFHPANAMGGISPLANATNSGYLCLKLDATGQFSGALKIQNVNLPFSGKFDLDQHALITVFQRDQVPLTLDLQILAEDKVMLGVINRGEAWSSSVLLRHAGDGTPYAGSYTFLIEGCDNGGCFLGGSVPNGDSVGTLTVTRSGALQMAGTLSDAAPMAQATLISDDGFWPLFVSAYRGRGMLIGWLHMREYWRGSSVIWEKDKIRQDPFYPDGFISPRVAIVSPYTPPRGAASPTGWTNGTAIINSGNLPIGIRLTNEIAIKNNRVIVQGGSISNLTLVFSPANGLFQGTFVDPVTKRLASIKGVVIQQSPEFFEVKTGGWYLGTNASGTIRLAPLQNPQGDAEAFAATQAVAAPVPTTPPSLTIERKDSRLIVSWPDPDNSWTLEESEGLGSAGWSKVESTTSFDGCRKVAMPASGGNKFFRLVPSN